jgi:uncharacterized membrane protein YkoI
MRAPLALAILLLLGAQPASAQPQPDTGRPSLGAGHGDTARARQGQGRQIPLAEVLQKISKSHKGRQLNTTMGDAGGRPAYFIQWQEPGGRVVILVVDAETGAMLGQQ